MTALTCSQLRDVAPEVALGALVGRERAAALAHLNVCAECRLTVEDLSDAADALLLVAPDVAPPSGFAERMDERMAPRRALRWRAPVRATAVAFTMLAAAVGFAVHGWKGAPSHPPFSASTADVRLARFVPSNDEQLSGELFSSTGTPTWVFMTVHSGDGGSDLYRCQLDTGDGRWIDVGTFQLHDGVGTWGKAVAPEVRHVKAARLLDDHGSVAATASLD